MKAIQPFHVPEPPRQPVVAQGVELGDNPHEVADVPDHCVAEHERLAVVPTAPFAALKRGIRCSRAER